MYKAVTLVILLAVLAIWATIFVKSIQSRRKGPSQWEQLTSSAQLVVPARAL